MFPLSPLHILHKMYINKMHESYRYFSSIKCDKQCLTRARYLDMNVSPSYVLQRVNSGSTQQDDRVRLCA